MQGVIFNPEMPNFCMLALILRELSGSIVVIVNMGRIILEDV